MKVLDQTIYTEATIRGPNGIMAREEGIFLKRDYEGPQGYDITVFARVDVDDHADDDTIDAAFEATKAKLDELARKKYEERDR